MSKFLSSIILWSLLHTFAWGTTTNTAVPVPANFTGKQNLASVLSSQSFVTTGEATFSILFWDLYKSYLKTTSGTYPISFEKDQLIFHINYLANISKKELIKRTVEQWQHQGIAKNTYQHYVEQLIKIWPDINKGDSLAILIQKDNSVFYFNDQYIGVINDDVFGQLFVNIWLDKTTSQPSLRAQLLGEK